jgi:hypothetical protein
MVMYFLVPCRVSKPTNEPCASKAHELRLL